MSPQFFRTLLVAARSLSLRAGEYGAYVVVRLGVSLLQALPLSLCEACGDLLAIALWRFVRIRRGVIEANLETAFPAASAVQRERIALAMWRHLLLMAAEVAHARRKISRTNWRRHTTIVDLPKMVRQLLSGRPTVLLTGHLGNFELGGYLLGLHGFPTHTIARPLDNRPLDRWLTEFRGATGQRMLSKHGSSEQIKQVLDAGGTLALLCDQAAGDGALWVDFFDKPASTHKAVALFTLAAQAPTAVCATLRTGGPLQFELRIADLADPASVGSPLRTAGDVARWYTRLLEELIRRQPQQYWWVHRRWKGNPAGQRAGRRAARAA